MQLDNTLPLFEEQGAQIIAISTDTQQVAQQTQRELEISFPLIPDNRRKILNLYDHKERYSDLNVHNPAVYIIDRQGIVRFAHFGSNAGDRPDPFAVYNELLKIKAER